MQQQSRALAVFGGLAVAALFAVLVVVPRLTRAEPGIAGLPSVSRDVPAPPLASGPPSSTPYSFKTPSLSKTQIAFAFGGEIWTVPREGGTARKIVSGQQWNTRPVFSPDGTQIAFSGVYDGNVDVYVVAAIGGEPKRLTYHPGQDIAVAWTSDGSKIAFVSNRTTERDNPQLWTVAATGGPAEKLPFPSGNSASFSPDGKRLAYEPYFQWQPAWKHYRGGQTSKIWIADLATSHITLVPRENSNDKFPMWADANTLYFVSDRDGPKALYSEDLTTQKVSEVARDSKGFDINSAQLGPGGIVYDRMGQIALYDFATKQAKQVPIAITDELPQTRARFMPVSPDQILHAAISPSGKRVLLEAHGEILSVPVEKGSARNLTSSPGIADRSPAWSPDGKWIAWLSDRTGEYALYFGSPDGLGPLHSISLGSPGSFFYTPRWSPDSKKLVIVDKRHILWLVDTEHPTLVKIDKSQYEDGFLAQNEPTWSPDSQWITYGKLLPNLMHAVFVYSLVDKQIHQVTDGRSECSSPRFDRSGKYLWFLASTNLGPAIGSSDMSGMGRAVTSSAYAIVLRKDQASPFASESDEETAPVGSAAKPADKAVKIDFENLDQRIVAVPVPRANYSQLEAGDGALYLTSGVVAETDEDIDELAGHEPVQVQRLDLKTRKLDKFIDKMDAAGNESDSAKLDVSADGSKVLFSSSGQWFVVDGTKPAGAGEGALKLDDLQVWVDPRAEWKQMFHETWRIERDFLYDPKAHGLDLAQAEKVYSQFLDGLGGREGLNDLFVEMLGNIVLGHVFVGGGAMPAQTSNENDGLLGCDLAIEGGHYKIAKILRGENWNPSMKSPLTEPGVIAKEGDFILAVNGVTVLASEPFDRYMLGTAGKRTVLTLATAADGKTKHDITVVPQPSEAMLRFRQWMEDNKRRVDTLSNGKLAYVYVPDTASGGFLHFNRYFYSQTDKQGVIVDERFNHGGFVADYVIRALQAQVVMAINSRDGDDTVDPVGSIPGPRVMIANQMSGSGGDALPWLFKRAKLGPLVGMRTWGGLVGIGDFPHLIDGGVVTAPRSGLFSAEGKWEIENKGVPPDVEIEQDPELVRKGHDPQLEKAVELALDALAKNPVVRPKRPAFPDYGPRLPQL